MCVLHLSPTSCRCLHPPSGSCQWRCCPGTAARGSSSCSYRTQRSWTGSGPASNDHCNKRTSTGSREEERAREETVKRLPNNQRPCMRNVLNNLRRIDWLDLLTSDMNFVIMPDAEPKPPRSPGARRAYSASHELNMASFLSAGCCLRSCKKLSVMCTRNQGKSQNEIKADLKRKRQRTQGWKLELSQTRSSSTRRQTREETSLTRTDTRTTTGVSCTHANACQQGVDKDSTWTSATRHIHSLVQLVTDPVPYMLEMEYREVDLLEFEELRRSETTDKLPFLG